MPLTAAEKQRRYRQKRDQDPQRRAEYLAKERQFWHDKKRAGKVLLIKDMNEREKRAKRKGWRTAWKKSQEKKRKINENLPPTPDQSAEDTPNQLAFIPQHSRQHNTGRKVVRKDRARCYSKIKTLEEKIKKQTRAINKYKQRLSRLQRKNVSPNSDSPRSKTRKLMKYLHVQRDNVSRILTFHHAVMDDLKEKYSESKNERQKSNIARCFTGKLVRKYKMQKLAQQAVGFSQRRWAVKVKKVRSSVSNEVKSFFLRDDNSRITTGKKQTVTVKKDKQQKRILTDSMKNLHAKFLGENAHTKCSYALFCKLRPFYCVRPNIDIK